MCIRDRLYLDDKIQKTELEAVAKELQVSNLDKEIQWFKDSKLAIESSELKNQLKSLGSQHTAASTDKTLQKKETRVVSIFRNARVIGLAASIALLVGAVWFFTQNAQPSLYDQYAYNDPGLPVLMSETSKYLSLIHISEPTRPY